MKNNIYKIMKLALLSVLLLSVFTACVDEMKFDFIERQDIPDSNDGATQLVIGTYSMLSDDMFRWNIFPTVLDFDCDYVTGPDWAFREFGAGNFQDIENVVAMWEKPYVIIHRANAAIESIEKMQNVSERYRKNVYGELNFLKAYSYFLLVRSFGDVPIRKRSINETAERNVPRSSVKDVYAYIIELLKDAEEGMYKNTDAQFIEGRASAGAAAGMLAKVYATMASAAMPSGEVKVKGGVPFQRIGDNKVYTDPQVKTFSKVQVSGYESFDYKEYYKLAAQKAKQVIGGEYGSYDLLPYNELWKKENKNKTEHMFNLQAISNDPTYGLPFSVGYAGIYTDQGYIQNGLWYGMRDHWYKLFENQDERIVTGVLHRWARIFDVNNVAKLGSFYPDTEEYRQKVRDKVAPFNDNLNYVNNRDAAFLAYLTKYDDRTDKKIERSDATWHFLRFADVLLIYAEADAEANESPTTTALAALNRVRKRSKATEKSLTGTGAISGLVDFRSAVLEERAMEFAMEGDRRSDLIRWGIYVDVMNNIGGTDEVGIHKLRTSKHTLFPIPITEMNTNSSIEQNNPGWN